MHPVFRRFYLIHRQKGFTLIELLVVIAVIAVLSSIGFFAFSNAQQTARDARRRADIKSLQNAAEQYFSTNNAYPINEAQLSENLPEGIPVDPVTEVKYVYGGAGISNSGPTGYCYCARLEKAGTGNADGPAGVTCNYNSAGGDFYCLEGVQ